jgi:hypothetical protein
MNRGFQAGYLYKEATDPKSGILDFKINPLNIVTGPSKYILGLTEKLVTKIVDYGVPALVVAPLLAGGAAGYVHSKITEPTEKDLENEQKKMVAQELREQLAELDQRSKQPAPGGPRERSLHL